MNHPVQPTLVAIAALILLTAADPRRSAADAVPDERTAIRELSRHRPLGAVRLPFDAPELVDPRSVLPDLSRYPVAELTALYRYSRSCVDEDRVAVQHPSLMKARTWHYFLCNPESDLPPRFFDDERRFHPGGSSFVALAAGSGQPRFGPKWLRAHTHRLHVMESDILLSAGLLLDEERRMLHRLAPQNLRRLVDREPFVVDDDRVFILATAQDPLDPGTYRVYSRESYDAIVNAKPDRFLPALAWIAGTVGFALLGVILVQAFRRMRLRRLLMHERARVLRTLAHEVRTPTASLKLLLEELRGDYDELPASAQKGFLALCDEVNRLERVIRESGRYLGAFRRDPSQAYRRVQIESVNAFVKQVLEPHEDRLTLELLEDDPGVVTDPYWLAVCIRNLVDNALTHGAPPVVVRLHADRRRLHISVTDGGAASVHELHRGLRPFLRTQASPGFGLGLAIVADTVAGLQGKLTWSTQPTRFTMSLKRPS